MSELTASQAWQALRAHREATAATTLLDLFAQDPARFDHCHLRLDGLLFDYAKTHVTATTLGLLRDLAERQGLAEWRARMFAGDRINSTENRAVLHTALRNRTQHPVLVDGQDVMPDVAHTLARMEGFVAAVRSGVWKGATGQSITDIVNIGIGGSDLGPRCVVTALQDYGATPRAHFVANADPDELLQVFHRCDPARTLFVVVSKSFSTQETILNAQTARQWLTQKLGDAPDVPARHMVAVSTNSKLVTEFGIPVRHMFGFQDWVGGRYSLWSPVGLSVALALGMERFLELLDGAQAMDAHFRNAPFTQNIPVLLALIGIWYRNFFGTSMQAVLPYAERLRHFPAYLQQLEMESNGKSVDREGRPVDYATTPVLFGVAGTVGQHSFYQMLHQGTDIVPADFIGVREDANNLPEHHRVLLANFLAQPEALMRGRSAEELRASGTADPLIPHRRASGNRPSVTMLLDRLDAYRLGMLIALYEHKTFTQGVIWNINSFDQWGVELGKQLAGTILADLAESGPPRSRDSSTNGLLDLVRRTRA